jgi:hypothetical protein
MCQGHVTCCTVATLHSQLKLSACITNDVCKGGGVYLIYLHSCAFKYSYIL